MRRDWFRIDLATFLTSLVAGLLPVAVISVISYIALSTLSQPLFDIVWREHLEILQQRVASLDGELLGRLTRLERDLVGAVNAQPAATENGTPDGVAGTDRDLVTAVDWYMEPVAMESSASPDQDLAEDILRALPMERDPARRRDQVEALATLPGFVQDPVGFSYGLEAALHLNTVDNAALARVLLTDGPRIDRATFAAVLARSDGRLPLGGGFPDLVPRFSAPVVSAGEFQLAATDGSAGGGTAIFGVPHPAGGILAMTLRARPLVDRALDACGAGSEYPDGVEVGLRERVRPAATDRTEGAGHDLRGVAYPLAFPFGVRWELELVRTGETLPVPLQLLERVRGVHYIGWVLGVLLIGAVATILLGAVASRRVQLSQQKDDLLRLVSHELRTPISSVKLLAETLSMGRVRDESDRREMIRQLEAEAGRLSELVERVLEYGRTDGGRARVREVITDPGELVEDAVALFRERHADAGDLVVRTAQEFHPVVLDRDAVMRVVMNLLSNARKFSGPDSPIEVTVGEASRSLFIEVRDQGPGLRKREQRRVFRAFYRGPHGARTPGFGLGLAYCRRVAEAHRGKMRVRSAPGCGAAFTLEIPLVLPAEAG